MHFPREKAMEVVRWWLSALFDRDYRRMTCSQQKWERGMVSLLQRPHFAWALHL